MRTTAFNHLIITVFAISALFTACSKDKDGKGGVKITMIASTITIPDSDNGIGIAGTGDITIDWGDGTGKETFSLSSFDGQFYDIYDIKEKYNYKHYYGGTATRTITITGENITALTVGSYIPMSLTSLDVSSNITLTYLSCYYNQLTTLDVSSNTKLIRLYFEGNQLTASALNDFFRSLPDNTSYTKRINGPHFISPSCIVIFGNPGTSYCDVSIAEEKGWRVWH